MKYHLWLRRGMQLKAFFQPKNKELTLNCDYVFQVFYGCKIIIKVCGLLTLKTEDDGDE